TTRPASSEGARRDRYCGGARVVRSLSMGDDKCGFTVFDDQAAPRLLGVSSVEAAGRTHPVAEINTQEAIGFHEFMCMSIAVKEMTKIAHAPDAIPWVKQTRCIDHEGSRRRPDLLEVIPDIAPVVMDMPGGDGHFPAGGQHLAQPRAMFGIKRTLRRLVLGGA